MLIFPCHLHGIVVNTLNCESAGPGSGLILESWWPACPDVLPSCLSWLMNGYLGKSGEDKVWEPSCFTAPVSQGSGSDSVTKVTTVTTEAMHSLGYASAPPLPLPYLISPPVFLPVLTSLSVSYLPLFLWLSNFLYFCCCIITTICCYITTVIKSLHWILCLPWLPLQFLCCPFGVSLANLCMI